MHPASSKMRSPGGTSGVERKRSSGVTRTNVFDDEQNFNLIVRLIHLPLHSTVGRGGPEYVTNKLLLRAATTIGKKTIIEQPQTPPSAKLQRR